MPTDAVFILAARELAESLNDADWDSDAKINLLEECDSKVRSAYDALCVTLGLEPSRKPRPETEV